LKRRAIFQRQRCCRHAVVVAACHGFRAGLTVLLTIPQYEVEFDKLDEFSSGSFGSVHRGQWKCAQVVVKKLKLLESHDAASSFGDTHEVESFRIPRRPTKCSEEAPDLVERMCRYDPNERVGIKEVADALKRFYGVSLAWNIRSLWWQHRY
jgi:hypothetical protein